MNCGTRILRMAKNIIIKEIKIAKNNYKKIVKKCINILKNNYKIFYKNSAKNCSKHS